jgi:hypothetical protein
MSLFNFGGMAKDLGKAWDNWVDQDAKPSLGLAYDMALAVGHGLDKAHTDQLASDWKKFGALHPSSGDTFNDVVQGSIAGPLGLGNLGLGAAGAVTDNVAGGKIPGYLNLGVHYVGRGITAATLSDMHSAVAGGVGALKGTLHGGAGEAVMRTLLEIGRVDQVDAFTDKALAEKRRLMGFGHRVYTGGDPRAAILKGMELNRTDIAVVSTRPDAILGTAQDCSLFNWNNDYST